jgi:predicted membrane-bound mannosyltransferase
LFVGCFACAFGILSPLHDVEIISMISVPAITVAVLAFRGVYKNSDDQLSPNMLKRLGAACVLAVMIWIPVFSVYENEHTPWSSVPVYLLLAVIATVGARRMA